ncbi:MAG: tRNA (adenosine(37)-N6)-threonylcarbamoyltransferase complex dimerization subunit type 1 TsaB [Clostridium sp.]
MMNILGIDSSGLVASVALQSDDKLVGEYTIHNKKTHSQTLLPMIHDMLEMADVSVKELDAIAIASGPGSFTGLRIGAATAKGLGGALSIPLIAVPTLEGLAYNLAGAEALVCPIMDARRQQAYYGIYDVSKEVPMEIEKPDAAPIEVVLQKAKETKREVIFFGGWRSGISGENQTVRGTFVSFLRRQRAVSESVFCHSAWKEIL